MKHIVFDIDGTLINTAYANLCALRDALLYHTGRDYPHEALMFSLGRSAVDTMKILGIETALYEAVVQLWEQNLLRYSDTVHYFPGIPEVVERIYQLGYPMGMVTSKSRSEYANEKILEDIRHCFDIVICAEDTQKHKPDPEPLLTYAAFAGVDIADVIYIGDSPYDQACAVGAGAGFIRATWGDGISPDAPETLCAYTPADILDMIE